MGWQRPLTHLTTIVHRNQICKTSTTISLSTSLLSSADLLLGAASCMMPLKLEMEPP